MLVRREERLDAVLAALMTADPHAHESFEPALALATDDEGIDGTDPDRSVVLALRSLAHLWSGRFEQGALDARAAIEAAEAADADAWMLSRAVSGWALGSWAPAVSLFDDPFAQAAEDPRAVSEWLEPVVRTLLVEGAIAVLRLDLAARVAEGIHVPAHLFGRADHPFLTCIRLTAARVHLLRGEVAAARSRIEQEIALASTPLARTFAEAHIAMVAANADERDVARRAIRDVEASGTPISHQLASGVYVIVSYAARAVNDLGTAARLVLRAAVDADLSNVRIADRIICVETLVRAALDAGDLDAALAWQQRAEPLASHPVAGTTVGRINARIALAQGDPETALALLEVVNARAIALGRGLEAAEGGVLAARAQMVLGQRGAAAAELATLARAAEARGHDATRAAASRELRSAGRRLPPHRASGWDGLSAREREVAVLLARGASNADIGAALFLSPHTVRSHVSRILHAFDTPTRAAVAAHIPRADVGAVVVGELTPRQREVAALVAAGSSNREIAAALGISIPTVEKHVTAVLQRWHLASRAGIGGVLAGGGGVGDAVGV